jgi:hypothetical protein
VAREAAPSQGDGVNALLDAALAFAAQGQPVLPCRVLDKRPATAHGLKDATTDVDIITGWWTENPDYNLAIRTGILADIIDVDGLEGMNAIEIWAPDKATIQRLVPTVLTPSGGYHIYVPPTGYGNRAGMLEHVDFRGQNAYVLVPPSRTERGSYRWV